MKIRDLINKYVSNGCSFRVAKNLTAEEILLTKISSSSLVEHVTLKGGIVMYNLTKNVRRATVDVDLDLIHYSIDKDSIKAFVELLNKGSDFSFLIDGDILDLHQEDYHGIRINLLISDDTDSLSIKIDIGVHTYLAMEQEKLIFTFDASHESISLLANSPEQIFCEKMFSLARLGRASTRYKDIFDMYYLLSKKCVDMIKVREYVKLFLTQSKREPHDLCTLQNVVEDTLKDKRFRKAVSKPYNKWLDDEYDLIASTITDFINRL